MRRAVTIVELLVVVGILAILVSLVLLGLAGIRERSRSIRPLADLRTNTQAAMLVTNENDGLLPSPPEPDAYPAYFVYSDLWRSEFGQRIVGGNIDEPPMSRVLGPDMHFHFMYSSTMYASPEYWMPGRERTTAMLRPQRLSSALDPARKAIFISPVRDGPIPFAIATAGWDRNDLFFALLDGHAAKIKADDLTEPDPRGDGPPPFGILPASVYGMHTIDGIRGRDIR